MLLINEELCRGLKLDKVDLIFFEWQKIRFFRRGKNLNFLTLSFRILKSERIMLLLIPYSNQEAGPAGRVTSWHPIFCKEKVSPVPILFSGGHIRVRSHQLLFGMPFSAFQLHRHLTRKNSLLTNLFAPIFPEAGYHSCGI